MDLEQAKVHHERGQLAEAEAIYTQLLNADFDRTDVLFLYGTLLVQQGKHGLASNVLRMALDDSEQDISVYQNLSNCYKVENREKETRDLLRMAIEKKPNAELWACLGNTYINNGTPEEALKCYREALIFDPGNDLIKFHIGLACLELGKYPEGWEGYAMGFRAGNRTYRGYRGLPEWKGEPDKTVIVWGEQGIGDEIMFASCLPEAIKLCKKVIFDCHPRMVETFKRSFPEVIVHGTRKNQFLEWFHEAKADAHCSITTLAAMWRKEKADFPRVPYVKADSKSVTALRAKGNGKLRVGFSWTGGTKQTRKDLRSFNLEQLLPILQQDCDFYSLQYTPESAREVCQLEEKTGIRVKHFPDKVECKNYDETINFIASMDLVISVCTTAIHAAGALGVPCWILTPSAPAWRYGLDGERHDWYGSVRMFRQKKGEDWKPVIGDVANSLKELVQNREKVAA
jgi:tetratricopeptide (TPR) repeat protein